MNGNLLLFELKRNRIRFLIWLLILGGLIAFTMAAIPSMAEDQAQMESMLEMFPEGFKKAFGMDAESWGSTLGIYSTYHIFYAYLSGAIFAISLGLDIVAKEENKRTAEFLLTRPVTRAEIMASKAAAFFIYVLALNILLALAGWAAVETSASGPLDMKPYLIFCVYGFLLNLLFGCLGLLIPSIVKRGKISAAAGIGIVLGFYFIDSLARASEVIGKIGFISPFHAADTKILDPGYSLELWRIFYFVIPIVLFTVSAFIFYRKKDIYV
ncbi:MAG: ABC transporter permease [Spirochaetia bacterium]